MTQENTGLITTEGPGLRPAEVVQIAAEQAKLLMDIVEKTQCYQNISGKKYLQVEAWETIGAFNRTHAETESIIPLLKDNIIIGYQAHVQLWKDGVVVGGAIMPCYFTENCCKGKEGDAKHKAGMSAAQTFATSKAYRMNYSYVAILAGYQPMPAEEITQDMTTPRDKSEHWCSIHNTEFFKRGKMKWYAHKIEGTDSWCSEEQSKKKAGPAVTPEKEPEEFIDMNWLKESLETLRAKNLQAWTESSVLEYMKTAYKVEAPTVLEAAAMLDQGMATHFHNRVQETLDMA